MNYSHPIIAREGWPFIAANILLIILSIIFLPAWLTVIFFILLIFVVQFFRDPPRTATMEEGAVVSPADGIIVKLEKTKDPFTNQDALLISVFMNVFNVHSNRAAVDGTVQSVNYFPGEFVNASLDKASKSNERNAVVIKTPEGHLVTLVQVAGLVARRILCYVKAGDKLSRGERYGFIRFGSRVDVYLPAHAKPEVIMGDKVYATNTILAKF